MRVMTSLLVVVVSYTSMAQCVVNGINGIPWEISEVAPGSFEVEIEVSDSVHADFFGPQGICGVTLSFSHEQVSDLTIELIAPNDSSVMLIGPAVPNGSIFSIFGVNHNLTFVPNSGIATPDMGFMDTWSNQNTNWGADPILNGTYYPHLGDFDVSFGDSPVSGTWRIRVSDEFLTAGGIFESFELIFCEEVSCFFCEAQVDGYDMPIELCVGTELNFSAIETNSISEAQNYTTLYFLDNSGTFVLLDTEFPFEDLPIGSYEIYAVSVANDDQVDYLDSLNIAGAHVQNISSDICYAVSDPPLQLEVVSPQVISREVPYCPSEVPFTFENISINNPDTTFNIITDNCGNSEDISFVPIRSDALIESDTLLIGCSELGVTIDGSGSSAGPNAQINWIKNNFLIEGASGLTYEANNIGRYMLQIIDNGCISTDTVDVLFEIQVKDYSFEVGTITCDNELVNIAFSDRGSTFSANWTGPGIRSDPSNAEAITVDQPGLYSVSGLDTSGCAFNEDIRVEEDIVQPLVAINSGQLSCNTPNATVELNPSDSSMTLTWTQGSNTQNGGFSFQTSFTDSIFINAMGINGCTLDTFYIVPANMQIVSLTGGDFAITCANTEVSIGEDGEAGVDYQWTLEGNELSSASRITVNESGAYQLIGMATNGCADTAIYNVTVDTMIPIFTPSQSNEVITCIEDSVVLQLEVDNDVAVEWLSPDIVDVMALDQVVFASGNYQIEIRDTISECMDTYEFVIGEDLDVPIFEIETRDISCEAEMGLFSIETDEANLVQISVNDQPFQDISQLELDQESSISFRVIGVNGCSVDSFSFISDLIDIPDLPEGTPQSLVLDCIENRVVFKPEIPDSIYAGFYFINEEGAVIRTDSILFDSPGSFEYVVEGLNGCENSQIIEIFPNVFVDTFDLGVSNGIVCDRSSVTVDLSFIDAIPDLEFSWDISGPSPSIFENGPEITLSGEGRFILNFIDSRNGCAVSDTFDLVFPSELIGPFEYTVMDESCQGANDGVLMLDPVSGGEGSILTTLEGINIDSYDLDSLMSGQYTLSAADELGCVRDTIVNIEAGGMLSFELGEDISLLPREVINLSPTIILGDSDLSTAQWTYNGSVVAEGQSIEFAPEENGLLIFTATNLDGCTHSDTIRVTLILSIDDLVYIPNVFAPNSLSGNDLLIGSFSEALMSVNSFSIFDRWGNKMVSIENISPGQSEILWDGTYNGTSVQSGVYLYYLEVVLSNGVPEYSSGDVTLLR